MNSLPVLDTEEAAAFLHMSPATLRFWRHKGTGPKYFQLGGRRVFYRREDIDAWAEAQYAEAKPA